MQDHNIMSCWHSVPMRHPVKAKLRAQTTSRAPWGASLRIRMSSIMRCRNGEIVLEESMVLLRVTDQADCLICQATKQSLDAHLSAGTRSEPPLPRERFSPSGRSR